jgi:serine/threonine-protein kinase
MAKDDQAFERFKREAEIASSLGNRHIVEVLDFNTLPPGAPFMEGSPYMVMEFLVGEDLATRLTRQGRLSLPETNHILGQVVSALDAAHSRGIVHRDIKPENIFLCRVDDEDDFVKLLDFGLSKIRGAQKRLTANLSVLGTPWYMSPEQARGDADLDHRTDIYAFGVVLYQVLTGRVPFDGENVYGVLTQIATQPPPPPTRFVPGLPPRLEAAVLKSLSKRPIDRFSTAGELWEEAVAAMELPATGRSQAKLIAVPVTVPTSLPDGQPFRVPTPTSLSPATPVPLAEAKAPTLLVRNSQEQPLGEEPPSAVLLSSPRRSPMQMLEAAGFDETTPSVDVMAPTSPAHRAITDEMLEAQANLGPGSMPPRTMSLRGTPQPQRSSPMKLVLLSFGGTLLAGVGLWALLHNSGTNKQPQPPPEEVKSDTGTPSQASAPVQITLIGLPEGASVLVQGKHVGNPFSLPASPIETLVVVSAPGYQEAHLRVVPDHAQTMTVSLQVAETSTGTPTPISPTGPTAPSAPTASTASNSTTPLTPTSPADTKPPKGKNRHSNKTDKHTNASDEKHEPKKKIAPIRDLGEDSDP